MAILMQRRSRRSGYLSGDARHGVGDLPSFGSVPETLVQGVGATLSVPRRPSGVREHVDQRVSVNDLLPPHSRPAAPRFGPVQMRMLPQEPSLYWGGASLTPA
jgi:Tartrate dehydratase alpha subunit/Fumarate hydratase class I, N-terminal domain